MLWAFRSPIEKRERYFSHLWPQIPPINLVFGGSFSHREPRRSLRSSPRRQKRTTPRQRTPRQRRRARRLRLGPFFFVGHRNPPAAFDFFFAGVCRVDRCVAHDLSPSLLRRPKPREQNDDHDDHPQKNRVRVATPLLVLLLLFLLEPVVVQQSFCGVFCKRTTPTRKRRLRSFFGTQKAQREKSNVVDKKEEIFDDTLNVTQGQKSFRFLSLSSGASFLFHKTKTQKLRSRDIKPDAEERERERERERDRQRERQRSESRRTKRRGKKHSSSRDGDVGGVVFGRLFRARKRRRHTEEDKEDDDEWET